VARGCLFGFTADELRAALLHAPTCRAIRECWLELGRVPDAILEIINDPNGGESSELHRQVAEHCGVLLPVCESSQNYPDFVSPGHLATAVGALTLILAGVGDLIQVAAQSVQSVAMGAGEEPTAPVEWVFSDNSLGVTALIRSIGDGSATLQLQSDAPLDAASMQVVIVFDDYSTVVFPATAPGEFRVPGKPSIYGRPVQATWPENTQPASMRIRLYRLATLPLEAASPDAREEKVPPMPSLIVLSVVRFVVNLNFGVGESQAGELVSRGFDKTVVTPSRVVFENTREKVSVRIVQSAGSWAIQLAATEGEYADVSVEYGSGASLVLTNLPLGEWPFYGQLNSLPHPGGEKQVLGIEVRIFGKDGEAV
jgi:hypothetical protein